MVQSVLVSAAFAFDAASAGSAAMLGDQSDSTSSLGGIELYLDVTLNGSSKGLVHFVSRDGALWASQAILRQLGFRLADNSSDPLRLGSLQGVHVEYDAARQSVNIVAPLRLLDVTTTLLDTSNRGKPVATVSPGVLLNYNLYGTYGEHDTASLSAFNELRAFNSWGVFSTTELTQDTRSTNADWQSRSERLDTSWTMSFPDQLLSLRIGDTLTDAVSWSRATRIGGIQFGTNFALQPYLVTAPLPSFIGSATLPSDIQLYVNGMRQYSGQVPAGPFQLNTVPNINGAGNAQIVLTNALGQTTTLNFSLYGENQLLRQGLADWSGEVGLVRKNYGLNSFDYGSDPAASGTWRYGISNNFTVQAHAEATNGLSDGGVGGVWLLGSTGGILSASLAHSTYAGSNGEQYGLGYSWTSDRFNFGLNGMRTSGAYRDVATLYGSPIPSLSAQASISYNFERIGNLGVSYIDLHYSQQAVASQNSAAATAVQFTSSRYANAYWYKSINRSLALNMSFSQDLQTARNRTFFLTATLALDHGTTVSASAQKENGQTTMSLNALQSLPSQGGFGWRASLNQGGGQSGGAGELDFLGRYGQLQTGVYAVGDTRYGYAGAMGSLVLMGGGVFAARQINDGFAVVSTDGIAGVPVNLQNNPVGTTNDRGLLLITPLNAYQNNRISIDPMNLPADMSLGKVDVMATPADRSGTLVQFDIKPVRSASLILFDVAGKPLPLGSRVRLHGKDGDPALVGFDGAVYLDALDLHNTLDVETRSGTCHVRFDYRKEGAGIPQIGPLACE
jgi:outer membrane usher protein